MSNKASQPAPSHRQPSRPANAEAMPGDLERLRDILFGQQARTTEERLNALEAEVERVHRELTESLKSLGNASSSQLMILQKELNGRLDEQAATQTQTLHLGLEAQRNEQTTQLSAIERRIEQLASDLFAQIRAIRQELTERLDQASADSRQRDDALRQELVSLTKSLDDGKVSRQDLSQMLIELGRKLQQQD